MKEYVIWMFMVVVCAVNFAYAVDGLVAGKFMHSLINCVAFIAMIPAVFKSYEEI